MITFCPLRWRHRESGVSTPLRTELSTDSGDNSGGAQGRRRDASVSPVSPRGVSRTPCPFLAFDIMTLRLPTLLIRSNPALFPFGMSLAQPALRQGSTGSRERARVPRCSLAGSMALAIGLGLAGCADGMTQQLRTDIARCQAIPRQQGQYERRVRCELEAESRAYLAQNPAMAATWREFIADTLAEYAAADRGEQTLAEADADARVLREAAEAGTGCLTDACGPGSRWHFPIAY